MIQFRSILGWELDGSDLLILFASCYFLQTCWKVYAAYVTKKHAQCHDAFETIKELKKTSLAMNVYEWPLSVRGYLESAR